MECSRCVARGVPQQSELSPAFFSIFINDLAEGTECTLGTLGDADGIKLGRLADILTGCAAIQQDRDRQRGTSGGSTGKSGVLYLGSHSPLHQDRGGFDFWKAALQRRT